MFFTQEAWDRFRLGKEEFALVKEADEKKEKDKADAAKKDPKDTAKDKEAKVEDLAIEFDGLSIRKARLTIHSSMWRPNAHSCSNTSGEGRGRRSTRPGITAWIGTD